MEFRTKVRTPNVCSLLIFFVQLDQENEADEQDDDCWCDGELASWGVQNRVRITESPAYSQ